MSAFDDLVPTAAAPAQAQGAFDDLVPTAGPEATARYAVAMPQVANQLVQRQLALGSMAMPDNGIEVFPHASTLEAMRRQQVNPAQYVAGGGPMAAMSLIPSTAADPHSSLLPIPRIPPGQNWLTRMLSGGGNLALGFAGGLTSPESIAAIASGPLSVPYFTYQMGKGTVEQGAEVARLLKAPGPVDAQFMQQLYDAMLGTGSSALLAGQLGYHGLKSGVGMLKGGHVLPTSTPSAPPTPDAVMEALAEMRKNQIVRQTPTGVTRFESNQPLPESIVRQEQQPGASTQQQVAPVVQQPPVPGAVGPTPPPVEPVAQPVVAPLEAHPPLDFSKPGVQPLEMSPIGSVRVGTPEAAVPETKLTAEQEKAQAQQARLAEQQRELPPQAPASATPQNPVPIIANKQPIVHGQPQQQQQKEPNDTQVQQGIQGGIPQGEEPGRTVPVQSGGQETPQAGGVLQAPQGEVGKTPLRQEVEKKSDFLHDLNNFASLVSGAKQGKVITDRQAVRFKREGNVIAGKVDNGEMTQEQGANALRTLRLDIQAQKDLAGELGPQEAPELAGPKLMEKLGLRPGKSGSYNTEQLLGTLRNKLNPSEWQVYKDLGIEKAFGGNVKGEDVVKWMRENGPRVEVRTVGEGATTPEQKQLRQIQHQLDTQYPGWEQGDSYFNQLGRLQRTEGLGLLGKYEELARKIGEDPNRPMGEAHWQSIAPKPEDKMPGYVEGAVVLPTRRTTPEGTRHWNAQENQEFFPSSHSFPPNTLTFFRGYMEHRADGGKTFHVIEVQSDWEKQVRNDREYAQQFPTGMSEYGREKFAQREHPLLKNYESLALKAAIEHARKEGADRIAVSDAETAMMTEGHDRFSPPASGTFATREEAESSITRAKEQGLDAQFYVKQLKNGDWQVFEAPSQAAGMRLHYDRTLPGILKDLTGSEGKKVEFGEHKMAFKTPGARPPYEPDEYRNDLIFRNPDNTPKTTVSAREFPLDKARHEFTLFGSDKPAPGIQSAPSSPERDADIARFKDLQQEVKSKFRETGKFPTDLMQQMEDIKNKYKGFVPGTEPQEASKSAVHKVDTTSLSPYQVEAVRDLNITQESNAHNIVNTIASNPGKFGAGNAELAGFLAKNFEHVLRDTGVDLGVGRSVNSLPNYDPIEHRVYLAARLASAEAPLVGTVLEEAAHAATFWSIEHPVTEVQKRAASFIKDLMAKSKELMPESELDKIGEQTYGLPYRHSSLSEFVAGMFADSALRRHLESFKVSGQSAWGKMVDWVKDVLGIQKGTAFDKAMDQLIKVGQEKASIDPNRRIFELDPISAPSSAATATVMDRTLNEKVKGTYNDLRGYSVPKHVAAGEEVANRLVRYASARIAAPEVAKWMATDVLGERWKDSGFSTKLGSVLVEDRLRAIRSGFLKLAAAATDPVEKAEFTNKANSVVTSIGMPGSAFKTEADFKAALADGDIRSSLAQHRQFLGPMTENMHKYLGGKLAEKGEDTDAFVNLVAMLTDGDPNTAVKTAKDMIFGATRGNLANPRVRGSVFSKEAKGTGEGYDFDYRKIAERMVRGNYEQYALKRYYEKLVEQGLAVEEKPGVVPPTTIKGMPLEKIEIKPSRAFISGMNLWIRKDLAGEMRRAMDVDKVQNIGLRAFTDLTTDLQIIGPTDAAWHTVNMLANIATSQGAKSMWYDAIRKLTPVGVVDGMLRMGYNTTRAILDEPGLKAAMEKMGLGKPFSKAQEVLKIPELQETVAEYSRVGAGRARPIHQGGILSKAVSALTEIPLEKTQKYDPFYYINKATSLVIKSIDKGGRVTASKMFDNLVERGWVEDTELDRREFINKMGQYNSKLMPQWQVILKDNAISPFVVAGKTMNRQAVRRLISPLTGPGFRTANLDAWVKTRFIESASLASMLMGFPIAMNLLINGKPFPRPGIPLGGIDLGTDDDQGKPRYFDPLQLLLIRRGLRITGLQAALQATDEELGTSRTARQVVNDIFAGYVHPWAGPAVRTASTLLTGKDFPSGYLMSRNPGSLTENVVAALKNLNPSVAALFRDSESGKASPKSVLSSLGGAVGLKAGRLPSHIEMLNQEAKKQGFQDYDSMPLAQKYRAERALEQNKQPRPILSERAGAERQLWEDFARQDKLVSLLPSDVVDWAKTNKLNLYKGFANELTMGKVRIPENQSDRDFMLQTVAKEYSAVLERVMKLPKVPSQDQLDEFLNAARARARVRLKGRLANPQPASTLGRTSDAVLQP